MTADITDRQFRAEGGSRRSHSIAAPDVSDELISYYRERKAGEQVRSLEAHNRPSAITRLAELLCRASGRRAAVAPGSIS